MSEIICVTNRQLCQGDFLRRIEMIAQQRPHGILLREKDLCEEEYTALAAQVMEICDRYGVACILHSFSGAAVRLGAERIHLPLPLLRELNDRDRRRFAVIGASCHCVEEVSEAVSLGADYVIAGHIFATDCKKGLPGRGLAFLQELCASAAVPVYAIGGISPGNAGDAIAAGAAGVCVMSGLMQCADVRAYMKRMRGESSEAIET